MIGNAYGRADEFPAVPQRCTLVSKRDQFRDQRAAYVTPRASRQPPPAAIPQGFENVQALDAEAPRKRSRPKKLRREPIPLYGVQLLRRVSILHIHRGRTIAGLRWRAAFLERGEPIIDNQMPELQQHRLALCGPSRASLCEVSRLRTDQALASSETYAGAGPIFGGFPRRPVSCRR